MKDKDSSQAAWGVALALAVVLAPILAFPARGALAPFVLPWNDAASGPTDFSHLNAPITEASRVGVDAAGHLSAAGQRIRFLGVNFASDSPFMPTNKADAVAARLAKFGINGVRFHHIDPPWAVGGGLIRYTTSSSRQFLPQQLGRLHFLVSRLAAHGIYTDLNLLTAREFRSGDGLGSAVTSMDWKDQHLLAMFNEVALNLQKEYATQLLAPTNPFTGLPLARDPSVAFVEILNENGLIQKWHEGALDRLPAVFASQLQERWNSWLGNRYVDDAALRTAWRALDQPLGTNLLRNGTFASGTTAWNLEQHSGAAASATRTLDFNGGPSMRIAVNRVGTESWHVQFNQPGLRLAAGQLYTLTFSARASTTGPLDIAAMMAHDPWQTLGLSESVDLTTQWQTFTRTFIASATDANARVNFGGIGTRVVTVWLADVRLQAGGQAGQIPVGATLTGRNLPSVLQGGDGFTGTEDARRDWLRFLIDLENRYYDAMMGHLRTHLGYPGLVFGTIMANSPAAVQSRLDVIDSHAYWQHPEFPGTPWDPVNWRVQNVSMVNAAPGETTLASLARQRLAGKPFFVTEYQHASPNSYSAEGPLLLAAYAALQDWDGIWMFDYGWGNDAPLSGVSQPMGRFRGYFDTGQHPAKMANLLLAANLFRRGDVGSALHQHVVGLNPETELNLLLRRAGPWSIFNSGQLDVPGALSFISRVAVDYQAGPPAYPPVPPSPTLFASDTGELRWVPSGTAGYMTFTTQRSRGAVGFIADRSLVLGDVELRALTNSLNWATIGLTLVEGDSYAEGGTALLVATARCENTGQQWRNDDHESLLSWGQAPSLVETVPLRLTLPAPVSRIQAWVLDERGQRQKPARVEASADQRSVLVTQPEDATLWYEIEIAPPPSASFDGWRRQYFSPSELLEPEVSGPGAAPAGDGIPNIVKYSLGHPPRTPLTAHELASWGVDDGGSGRRLWMRLTGPGDRTDTVVRSVISPDLKAWTPATVSVSNVAEGWRTVRAETTMADEAPAQGFLQLVVEATPVP